MSKSWTLLLADRGVPAHQREAAARSHPLPRHGRRPAGSAAAGTRGATENPVLPARRRGRPEGRGRSARRGGPHRPRSGPEPVPQSVGGHHSAAGRAQPSHPAPVQTGVGRLGRRHVPAPPLSRPENGDGHLAVFLGPDEPRIPGCAAANRRGTHPAHRDPTGPENWTPSSTTRRTSSLTSPPRIASPSSPNGAGPNRSGSTSACSASRFWLPETGRFPSMLTSTQAMRWIRSAFPSL